MNHPSKVIAVGVSTFLLGLALPVLLIWNPGGWQWAEDLGGRAREARPGAATTENAKKQLWTCSMHPHILKEEPGPCPICQMRLTPVRDSTVPTAIEGGLGEAEKPAGERKILYWRAPMDPNFTSDQPGKSPTGMDLIPVYEQEAVAPGAVRVDPSFTQNFAVRTAVAEKGSISLDIRTVGILSHNEKAIVSVNTRFEGWIEKAFYNNIGEAVQRGDPLFEIYSPQLVTTQKEYLAALDYVEKLSGSAYPEAVERARSLLESSVERMRYWNVTPEQIRQLEATRKVRRTVTVYSPASGFIVYKMGDSLEGMRLTPGMTVLKLADHSKLWAEVELYEHQIRHARVGQRVRVEVDAFPGRVWQGRIDFFDTAVDPKTRTLKAYVEVDNKDFRLRPEMFATVLIRLPGSASSVRVPSEAVLHSGERAVVIVRKADNIFEPREVELGAEADGLQAVLSGVRAGEIVVTSSQFLIDSESNLRAAITRMLDKRAAQDDPAQGDPAQGKPPPMMPGEAPAVTPGGEKEHVH